MNSTRTDFAFQSPFSFGTRSALSVDGGKSTYRPRTRLSALLLMWFLGLGLQFDASAQPVLTTIYTNGPVSNRLNVVILSEGYTSNQLGQFLVDATNAANVLLGWDPYPEYRSYFNVFAIGVPSSQSGSDHPNAGTTRDTYFNSSYDPISDYIITIPPNDQDTNHANGQGKVDALIQQFMPQCKLPVLLVNDPEWGGSDGFDKTAITYSGANLYAVLPHETGHVLANLGDEYDYAFPFPDTEEPNTTRETNRALVKWSAWISTNTPVPTPPTVTYQNDVGLFEGAHCHPSGWYRPKYDCTMRSFGVAFCEICRETMVKSFYERVRPIDAFIPNSATVGLATTEAQAFSVTVLQPLTHALSMQWCTNGTPVPAETNATFTLPPMTLPNGSHTVSVVVQDSTGLVRNDPANLLRQVVSWNVMVGSQMRLDSTMMLGGGAFVFRVVGAASCPVVVESSSDLTQWVSLATNSLSGGEFWYTNSTASDANRFFRAVAH